MAFHGRVLSSWLTSSKWFKLRNYRQGCQSNGDGLKYSAEAGRVGLLEIKTMSRSLWSCAGPLYNVTLHNQISSSTLLSPSNNAIGMILSRGKKSKRKGASDKAEAELSDDDDDDDDGEDDDLGEGSGLDYKDIRARVPSLRLDSILKAGLNMSRNKVENAFYGSKIRVNEEKVLKKSKQLEEGDEIDIIKGPANNNPDLINVSRVVIVKAGSYDDESDKRTVKLRRYQNLLIRKYSNSASDEE